MATATPADTTKISRKTLIEKLNEDLAREYQAIIAYVTYSQHNGLAGQADRGCP